MRTLPVDISSQCVDLSVVTQHAHGLRSIPARERVGRESRVHNAHKTREPLIAKVGVVVVCQLIRFQLPFIHNSPATRPAFYLSSLAKPNSLKNRANFKTNLEATLIGIKIRLFKNSKYWYLDDREQM